MRATPVRNACWPVEQVAAHRRAGLGLDAGAVGDQVVPDPGVLAGRERLPTHPDFVREGAVHGNARPECHQIPLHRAVHGDDVTEDVEVVFDRLVLTTIRFWVRISAARTGATMTRAASRARTKANGYLHPPMMRNTLMSTSSRALSCVRGALSPLLFDLQHP